MSDGFSVDLDALENARDGLVQLLRGMEEHPVRDLDAPGAAFGHDELAAATADFCDRWQHGVTSLLQDTRIIGRDLADSIQLYRRLDQDAATGFDQMGGGGATEK